MTEKLRDSLNRSDPNTAHDIFRTILLGAVLSTLRAVIRAVAPVSNTIVLPNMAKAKRVLSAYARAGAGTLGELTVSATPATPAAGEVGWSATGNILFNAADAWTSVDVEFEPMVNVAEFAAEGYPIAAGVMAVPQAARPAVMLLEVVAYNALGVASTVTILPPRNRSGGGTMRVRLGESQRRILRRRWFRPCGRHHAEGRSQRHRDAGGSVDFRVVARHSYIG